VISLHVSCESEHVLILAFLPSLFGSGDVELAGSVRDCAICASLGFTPSANTMPDVNTPTAASAAANLRDTIGTLLWTAVAMLAIHWMLPPQKGSQIYLMVISQAGDRFQQTTFSRVAGTTAK
jgi:hypothetical protein